jgi:hypothetical protein
MNGGNSSLQSSSSPLSSSSSQSNESFGVSEINNQSSLPSLTTQSSSPDQTIANIINKVGPLIGLLMNGGSDSSNNLDEGQGSSAYFSNDMNNMFDNSSSLSATNDFATSESTNKPLYHVSEFWLRNGTGEGEAMSARGIVVDQNNDTFVSDPYEDEIQKRDSHHNYTTWGSHGEGDGQFNMVGNMAIDSFGNVYVTEFNNNRIQKFDNNGTFITKWGSNDTGYGAGDGQFYHPMGIAIDSLDNVYVVDLFTDRVQKFDSNGSFITSWYNSTVNNPVDPKDVTTERSNNVYPKDVTTDPSNNVYVIGFYSDGISKFDSNGAPKGYNTFFSQISSPTPLSIAAGPDSIFVVVGKGEEIYSIFEEYSIIEFDNNLNYISTFDVNDLKPGLQINDIYVDHNNNIFATLGGEGYGKELIGVDMKVVKLVPQPDDTSTN